jgi:two-component system, OmpR family, response regulator
MAEGMILVVEDEESIASLVRAYLEREGYRVAVASGGAAALERLAQGDPRLVVLDLGLPDMDGVEVCRRVRAGSAVPIIMLTARDEEVDRVVGLEVGADDYVVKPFSPKELVARVRAVLRRADAPPPPDPPLRLGDVVVRPGAREVEVAGRPVELRAKEFDLLAYLMENRGVVLSRERLLEQVWGWDYEGGLRTVDTHVALVRRRLGRAALIQTVRGAGYKAVAP